MSYSPCHLSHIINLYPEDNNTCIGWARTQGRKCRNVVSAASRSEASHLLGQATKRLYQGKCIDDLLEDIASLVLCKRWHQDQALGISTKWQSKIDRYLAVPTAGYPQHKSHLAVAVPRSSTVVSRGDVDAERSYKVTRHQSSSRAQPSQSQAQARRYTRPTVQKDSSFPHSSSSTASSAPVSEDPSSDMFARTQRTRRVLMPSSSRINHPTAQPQPASKKESQITSIIEAQASSSCSASAPRPKVNRTAAPALPHQRLEDMNRTLDEYMQKVKRMEPAADTTEVEEDEEKQKSRMLREVKAMMPSASTKTKKTTPRATVSRSTQTLSKGEAIEKRDSVVDEYVEVLKLMEPGKDETDSPDGERSSTEKDKTAMIAQISQIAENMATVSNKKLKHKKRTKPVENAPTTSAKIPHEVEIDQTHDKPDTKHSINDAKKKNLSINTDIHHINTTDPEDLTSVSSHHSSGSFMSPHSSTSSLVTLPSAYPSMAMKRPHFLQYYSSSSSSNNNETNKDNSNGNKGNNNPHNLNPHPSSTTSTPPSSPHPPPQLLTLQSITYNSIVPNPPTPALYPHAYTTLTHSIATGLAMMEGVCWVIETIQLGYWMLFQFHGRDMRHVFWFGMYLWVLSWVGLL